ncbi:hypothetical protein [Streptomyces blattellae]|nr:hypothetical protein [Streptomyces blattellae]
MGTGRVVVAGGSLAEPWPTPGQNSYDVGHGRLRIAARTSS